MKLLKHMSELYDEELDRRSQELFDKNFIQLSIAEKEKVYQYIHDLSNPEWKPIILEDIKNIYLVSNTGLVKNKITNKILSTNFTHKGYLQVGLMSISKKKCISKVVHRLVSIAFIPNPDNKPQVNHINGKKTINWYRNLEWNTCKENIQHAIQNNLFYNGLGEMANGSIYSDEKIHQVCKLLETNKFLNTEISNMTGVDVSIISKIKCKDCWTHISFQYNITSPTKNATGENAAASKYTSNQIHNVCKMLQDPNNKMTFISKSTGVGYDMIYRIKMGKNWTEISSQYNIGKSMPAKPIKLE